MFFRFVVVLHSHFLFPRHLSPFRGLLPGFYTHFIFSAQPIAEWFATFSFSTIRSSSCRERNSLEWAFFTHRRFFTLRSFIDILTCVYHGFPGSRQSFLEVCRASYWWSSQFAGPFHLFVWFRVTCNLHTQNDSVLNSTIY